MTTAPWLGEIAQPPLPAIEEVKSRGISALRSLRSPRAQLTDRRRQPDDAQAQTQIDNYVLVKRAGGQVSGNTVTCGSLALRPPGLRGFRPHPMLEDLVEDIWDWDVPDPAAARDVTFRTPPSANPMILFQYRVPIRSDRDYGSIKHNYPSWQHVALKLQSGICTIRPAGPIGSVVVRLRPESAGRILSPPMQDFMDTKVHLNDLFDAGEISLVEEALGEAPDSVARVRVVQKFLLRHAKPRTPNTILTVAAARLRSNPSLQIGRLASELDVSERHLSRGFNTIFGTGPKQFARLLRVERAVEARRAGANWTDIAYSIGFSDQAHLIHDFNAITGAPPEAIFRAPVS
jgi:AraC-like DNA-binding protein